MRRYVPTLSDAQLLKLPTVLTGSPRGADTCAVTARPTARGT